MKKIRRLLVCNQACEDFEKETSHFEHIYNPLICKCRFSERGNTINTRHHYIRSDEGFQQYKYTQLSICIFHYTTLHQRCSAKIYV
jgi:hypothetical protein